MGFSSSYWESQTWFKDIDLCIIGSGIVGLNAAIEAKRKFPENRVVVLERGMLPMGASTRNAGFACFGSVTELLDDLEHRSEEEVFETVRMRWEGLKLLRSILGDKLIDYEHFGSYEMFTAKDKEAFDKAESSIVTLNEHLKNYLGHENIFSVIKDSKKLGLSGISHLIHNHLEGQLNPGKMMKALMQVAQDLGIEIWNGVDVDSVYQEVKGVRIAGKEFDFTVKKLILATNAFSGKFMPELDIKASRNQVILTSPISDLRLKGCFHYHKGYGYLRNVGNRVLIGGWRHLEKETENTEEFGHTPLIQAELMRWLNEYIIKGKEFQVAHRWSGILGTGTHKHPIIKRIGEHMVVAIRLGGMGIAIGSSVGQRAARLIDL
ncbi:MAG: FAD-binding oxidoreductase [Bacteroidia bacterium]|nr:FAD-binding oxidoreductase [Bacteroidia bacterium]